MCLDPSRAYRLPAYYEDDVADIAGVYATLRNLKWRYLQRAGMMEMEGRRMLFTTLEPRGMVQSVQSILCLLFCHKLTKTL